MKRTWAELNDTEQNAAEPPPPPTPATTTATVPSLFRLCIDKMCAIGISAIFPPSPTRRAPSPAPSHTLATRSPVDSDDNGGGSGDAGGGCGGDYHPWESNERRGTNVDRYDSWLERFRERLWMVPPNAMRWLCHSWEPVDWLFVDFLMLISSSLSSSLSSSSHLSSSDGGDGPPSDDEDKDPGHAAVHPDHEAVHHPHYEAGIDPRTDDWPVMIPLGSGWVPRQDARWFWNRHRQHYQHPQHHHRTTQQQQQQQQLHSYQRHLRSVEFQAYTKLALDWCECQLSETGLSAGGGSTSVTATLLNHPLYGPLLTLIFPPWYEGSFLSIRIPTHRQEYTQLCLHGLSSSTLKQLQLLVDGDGTDGIGYGNAGSAGDGNVGSAGDGNVGSAGDGNVSSAGDGNVGSAGDGNGDGMMHPVLDTNPSSKTETALKALLRPSLRRLQFDSCCLRFKELSMVARALRACPNLSVFSYDRSTVYEILDDDSEYDSDDDGSRGKNDEEEKQLQQQVSQTDQLIKATHLLFDMVLDSRFTRSSDSNRYNSNLNDNNPSNIIQEVQLLGLYWEYKPEILEKLERLTRKKGLRSLSLSFPATRHSIAFVERILGWLLDVSGSASSCSHSSLSSLCSDCLFSSSFSCHSHDPLESPPSPPPSSSLVPAVPLQSLALMDSRLDNRLIPRFTRLLQVRPDLYRLVLTGNRFSESGLVQLVRSALEIAVDRNHLPYLELHLTWWDDRGRDRPEDYRSAIFQQAAHFGLEWQRQQKQQPRKQREERWSSLERIRFTSDRQRLRVIMELQMEYCTAQEQAGFDER